MRLLQWALLLVSTSAAPTASPSDAVSSALVAPVVTEMSSGANSESQMTTLPAISSDPSWVFDPAANHHESTGFQADNGAAVPDDAISTHWSNAVGTMAINRTATSVPHIMPGQAKELMTAQWTTPLTTLGPILVVYITDSVATPNIAKSAVTDVFTASPYSVGGLFAESSWGQCPTLTASDVDVIEIAFTMDMSMLSLTDMQMAIMKRSEWAVAFASRSYSHWVMVAPGTSFSGTGYIGTRTATVHVPEFATAMVRGEATRSWQAISHELGHNLGLGHAGALSSSAGAFNSYQDDASMGFDRQRESDFTAVARFHLGWISEAQIARFPTTTGASIRALNEGPLSDGNVLMMTFPCSFCTSIDPGIGTTGGDFSMSFRVVDPAHAFGVSSDIPIYDVNNYNRMLLEDRVHLQYQPTGAITTELWMTFDAGAQFTIPGSTSGSGLFVVVCSTTVKTNTPTATTEYAVVRVSSTSIDAALADTALSTTLTAAYSAVNIADHNTGTLVCTLPAQDQDQWVAVEVPAGSAISYVAMYNRDDAELYRSWINPYEVWLGNAAGQESYKCGGPLTAPIASGLGPFLTSCSGMTGYTWVSIIIRATGEMRYLSISEMLVYGGAAGASASPPPPPPPLSPSPTSPATTGVAPAPPLPLMTMLTLSSPTYSIALHHSFPASNAIDGDVHTLAATGNAQTRDQWLSAALPPSSTVSYVAVYNREDAEVFRSWLNPYEIWLGTSPGNEGFKCGGPLTVPIEDGIGPFMTSCGSATGYTHVTVIWRAGMQRWGTLGELQAFGP